MLHINTEELAYFRAPATLTLTDIVKKCAECGVLCHNTFSRHLADYVLFNVKPLVNLLEILGLVLLDPLVFVNGVFNAGGNRTCYKKGGDELEYIGTCNLDAVCHILFKFFFCTLIHIAECVADRLTVFVNDYETLHL